YAKEQAWGAGSQYWFTHFSRSTNAPSFMPATSTAINPNMPEIRFTASGTVTHYLDDGRQEFYQVAAQDPLIKRRFSLAKLSWLTTNGPLSTLGTTGATAIRSCFGISWNVSRWDYAGGPAEASPSSIKTLAQVAAEPIPREPNFFELLKAGIIEG